MEHVSNQQSSKLSTSVIICTRNRCDDLLNCLETIERQIEQPDEIIIIDSSDVPLNENQSFAQKLTNSTWLYKHTRPGLTYQRNVGVDQAKGDILYFFDDDVLLEPTYLAAMNQVFNSDTNFAGGMGSVTGLPEKKTSLYRLIQKIFLLQRNHASGFFTASGMPTHTYGTNTFKPVQVLGGCCMAYRSWLFKHHRFDEKLERYAYMEDCDFSWRASQHAPLFFNPAARLQHLHSPLARDRIVENRAMYIKNYTYLFFKNVYPTNRLKVIAYAWTVFGLFTQALIFRRFLDIKGYAKGLFSKKA